MLRFDFLAVRMDHGTDVELDHAYINLCLSFNTHLSFFQRPPAEHMIRALELLYALEGQTMSFICHLTFMCMA